MPQNLVVIMYKSQLKMVVLVPTGRIALGKTNGLVLRNANVGAFERSSEARILPSFASFARVFASAKLYACKYARMCECKPRKRKGQYTREQKLEFKEAITSMKR